MKHYLPSRVGHLLPHASFWGLLLFLLSVVVPNTPVSAENKAESTSSPQTIFLPITQTGGTAIPSRGWLSAINEYRALAGLPAVLENPTLSLGDQDHARYMVKNNTVLHTQDPVNPWFTLEGLRAAESSNIVATANLDTSDLSAIDLWMQAPFHALVILEPALTEVGYGSYRESTAQGIQMAAALDVYQGIGSLPPSVAYPIQWPANGATVPLQQYGGGETIDPLVSCPGYSAPTGLPILLQLGSGTLKPEVTAHSFMQGSVALGHCLFDETSYSNPDSSYQEAGRSILDDHDAIVLIPRAPLTPGTTYTVSITANGQSYQWSFRVSDETRNLGSIGHSILELPTTDK